MAYDASMLEAYIDETGTDYAGRICAVAGFLTTPDHWNTLRHGWRLVCDQDPKTPDFHAYDAHNLRGAYWGWEQNQSLTLDELTERRDTRIMSLVEIVSAQCMHSLATVIDLPSYRKVIAPKFPRSRDLPYFILFWSLQFGLARWMVENRINDQVQFVFDDFSSFGRRAAALHPKMLGDLPPEASAILKLPPRFAHDKTEPALKAADLFAWHVQRDVNTMVKAGALWTQDMRTQPFAKMMEIPPLGQLLEEKELEALLPIIEAAKAQGMIP